MQSTLIKANDCVIDGIELLFCKKNNNNKKTTVDVKTLRSDHSVKLKCSLVLQHNRKSDYEDIMGIQTYKKLIKT